MPVEAMLDKAGGVSPLCLLLPLKLEIPPVRAGIIHIVFLADISCNISTTYYNQIVVEVNTPEAARPKPGSEPERALELVQSQVLEHRRQVPRCGTALRHHKQASKM